MKLKPDYTLKKIDDCFSVTAPNSESIKPFNLSKYQVFLWNSLKNEDLTSSELLNRLLNEFEISTVLALGEIDTFIKKCKENGILE